jgi:hypothetical protein
MKKLGFVVGLMVSFTLSHSQVIDGIPIDENGKINFNEVVNVDSASQDALYVNAKQFFVENFKSANHVIQMDDKQSGIIIGKGWSTYLFWNAPITLRYTIKIQCKDDRYKYEIYDISFFDSAASRQSAETFLSKKNYYKANGTPKGYYAKHRKGMEDTVDELARQIKSAMETAGSDKDDW